MCYGVKLNSYHTTKHINFILSSGESFSTENTDDYKRFEGECPILFNEILSIRKKIHNDGSLLDKIRKKYETKNTVGYSLNAFVDFHHPLDIFAHLLIGAERTLAFIAESVMETVADLPHKSTALLYFPDIYSASAAIPVLIDARAQMVELMDRASLRAVENIKGIDPFLKTLPPEAADILVEFQEAFADHLPPDIFLKRI